MIIDLDIVKLMLTTEYGKPFVNIKRNIEFNPIVSYTTRPKRSSETEGVEHYFITNEEADKLLSSKPSLAYTKIGDNIYFTLKEQLETQNVYIIDPTGIEDLTYKFPNMKKFIIYVDSSYENRRNRYINRSSECTAEDFEKRNAAEEYQFNIFESNIKYQNNVHVINNNSPYFVSALIHAAKLIINSYQKDLLYCVVGRTSSGKDTIVKQLQQLFQDTERVEL